MMLLAVVPCILSDYTKNYLWNILDVVAATGKDD